MQAGRAGRRHAGSAWLDSETETLSIEPPETDSRIVDWVEPHLIFRNPYVQQNANLLIFLAGSNGIPARQTLVPRLAAQMGFLAINLRYPNSWTIGGLCRQSTDPSCHERIRLHITEGLLSRELPGVFAHDSIVNRLIKLLELLARRQPDVAWAHFLSPGGVRWEDVVLVGHSQGGGHVAMLGKNHRVKHVVMLGAPVDEDPRGGAARWLEAPGETPPSCYYGFTHAADPGFERISQAWKSIGLAQFGDFVNVDINEPPYLMSHQLFSHARAVRDKYHGSVATDGATPLAADGSPLFSPVWRYLLSVAPPSLSR